MKKILSYLMPIVSKTIPSKHNGLLEITWINGTKVLDTANANYSYGSLQRILQYGLKKINVKRDARILVLGLGGGSVIPTIYQCYGKKVAITAVEIDEVIIDVAAHEFAITSNSSLQIICEDALTFIDRDKSFYDLIIIDLFVDDQVPQQFYEASFFEAVSQRLKPKGKFLFNAGMNTQIIVPVIKKLQMHLANQIQIEKHLNVGRSNTLVIGEKIKED